MVNQKKHLMNLYFLALSDGDFAPEELEVILEIAKEKGISKEEFNQLIINPPSGLFDLPENFLDKIFLLYDFVRIILADGVIEESETATFMKFCERFGFEAQISQELYDWLIELGGKNLTLEQVKEEITNLINS